MMLPNFPDQKQPGSKKVLATINNVAYLLDQAGIRCRYNTIKKKVEVELPGHQGTPDNLDNVAVTTIISLATSVRMSHTLVPEYINAVADLNAYNPVADWIRSKPWDGMDRLAEVYASVIAQPDYPDELKKDLLRKWLRSAAAAATVPAYKGRGVLTLQGRQGIGKTSWVKALVSNPALRESVIKIDHHLDAGNKDSILGAIGHWIVEIGELDSSFRRDVARLKGFLTADSDRLRRPYDRREAEYPRRTVFLATVNDGHFLVDRTGNSRWWTIAVDALDFHHRIDMQQVFAQVASEVEAGEPWWLNDAEEAALEQWNKRHIVVSVMAEQLHDMLDPNRAGEAGLPALTASEVAELLGYEKPTNAQAKECASALRDSLGDPKRINGIYRWRVPFREPNADDLKSKRKAAVAEKVKAMEPTMNAKATAPGEVF